MDTLADVGQLIRDRGSTLRSHVHERLFEAIPEARNIFSEDLAGAHVDLPRALAWVLERSLIDEPLDPALVKRLRELAKDHRRHGFPPDTYDLFGLLLGDAIAEVVGDDLPSERVNAAIALVGRVCSEMREAATNADEQGIAYANAAQVTSVEKPAHGVHVVQLEAGMPVEYVAGQQVPVKPTQCRGEWLNLSPAVPPNHFGQVEFHVPAEVPVEKGEYWTIGAARGDVTLDPERDTLLVGIGTGLAAVKALVFDLLNKEATQDTRPQVHVIIAAQFPAELYEVSTFTALGASQEWLTVTPVVDHHDNPVAVSGDASGDADVTPVAFPVEKVVSGVGMFWGRQIVVSGPDDVVARVYGALREAGALASDIQTITPTGADQWPVPGSPD
ncbi:globin domain-containing protein [Corynebacterium cystitidis]|uniref:globin domain-containing protein n=1 Tax=Corynebacterium cystitidis TaxID=35757 RepID=UPI00211E999E|nr:globin domain-containing protein [Corynebacterium cystitidis]